MIKYKNEDSNSNGFNGVTLAHAAYLESVKYPCSVGNSYSPLQRMDVLYKCFLEGAGDKELVFYQQYLRTAQTQWICVLFTVFSIFTGLRFSYIECFL